MVYQLFLYSSGANNRENRHVEIKIDFKQGFFLDFKIWMLNIKNFSEPKFAA